MGLSPLLQTHKCSNWSGDRYIYEAPEYLAFSFLRAKERYFMTYSDLY